MGGGRGTAHSTVISHQRLKALDVVRSQTWLRVASQARSWPCQPLWGRGRRISPLPFTAEETEVQRRQAMCQGSHSCKGRRVGEGLRRRAW